MTLAAGRTVRLEDRYELLEGEIYLSGLQALVRVPLDQHRLDRRNGLHTATFVSGYEGSPLAGYDLELNRRKELLDEHEVVFRPSVNEELGANAVQGSQLASTVDGMTHDGVVGIWYGKAPGLDRSTDALRHANLGGSAPTGGVLALVGDDSIAKSSTVPSSSEIAMAEIGMTVLSPSDPQDVLDLGLHGIALSRFSGLWTGLKLATNVVDGASTVLVGPERLNPVYPDATVDGAPYRHKVSARFVQPDLAELERSMVTTRVELARRYARANGLNTVHGDREARVGIVAAGATYLDARQALSIVGIPEDRLPTSGVRILKLGMVSPVDPEIVEEFAQGLDEIIVVEEKRAFLELAIKDVLYGMPGAPAVFGKRGPGGTELLRQDADLPPHVIATAVAPRLLARLPDGPVRSSVDEWARRTAAPGQDTRRLLPMVTRTPYFCSGCPHNRSTVAPSGSLVGAGIGCSALVALMPEERVGSVVGLCQMGGEGAAWIGMAPFVGHRHMIQNIGDGTYHHSGSLAVRAAVAAGVNITYKLLHNGAVAMTGGQQAVGKMAVPELVTELLAEGVAKVVITTEDPARYRRARLPRGVDVHHRDDLETVQQQLADVEGVTVLIHDQECATELRRKRKRKRAADPEQRIFINERVCEGCGDCGAKSNCLSVQPVETEFGRKTQIHQASCNKDYSCLDGDCPSFVTVRPGHRSTGRSGQPLAAEDLPRPVVKVPTDDFNLRITGIGGTGVVTTAQVISTAAVMAGMHVRSLDQMGMAQKGGAVVSDIKLSSRPFTGANKLGPGECDLYLGCDILVAANDANLAVTSTSRTIAVVSTAAVPTGAMVTDTSHRFPDIEETLGRITDGARPADSVSADARRLTSALFGDDQYANVFLVGMAVQAGALPVEPYRVEQALELNGVAVERNLQAFRRGRQLVADPRAFEASLPAGTTLAKPERDPVVRRIAATVRTGTDPELVDTVTRRVAELVAYQDARYAERYAGFVEDVRRREESSLGSSSEITLLVARNLYKLMAYKDEYEVARLCIDPLLEAQLKEQFGEDVRYAYSLHPPVLRALGMQRKISLGAWSRPVLRTLYGMRRLRGTRLDPFGRAQVRRTERSLVGEYTDAVTRAVAALSEDNRPLVAEVAALPDMVRGYEEIKMRNVAAFRERLATLLDWLESRGSGGRPDVGDGLRPFRKDADPR